MIKTFTCRICNEEFSKQTRSYAYYCDKCRKEKRRVSAYNRAVESGRIKSPGVGSGGNQWGPNNHQWSGFSAEYSYRHHSKDDSCWMCGSTKYLVRHHIDLNRKNNEKTNITTVCRSCHSKLHRLIDNINSRSKTTLIRGNSRPDNPEPSHNVEGVTTNPDECKDVSPK